MKDQVVEQLKEACNASGGSAQVDVVDQCQRREAGTRAGRLIRIT